MSKSSFTASAVVISLAFCAVPALQAAESQQPSKATVKILAAANEAYKAKRCPEAISKSREALAVGEKTPYDSYLAYRFLAGCYQAESNQAELMKAFQGQLDTGIPSATEQNLIFKNMYAVAFGMKDYAQAVELGNRLIRSGAATPDTYEQVASAMEAQGKKAEASKFLSDYIAEVEKRGQRPSESTLTRLRALQEKLGDTNGAATTLEKLVVHYSKPDYWSLMTYSLARNPKLSDGQRMQVFRLRVATGTLKLCRDYTEMAAFAVDNGMAGEGQKVIDQGLAAKVCPPGADLDRLGRLHTSAGRVATEERAKLPKLETDARAAKTGEPEVALGSSHFGFGEFGKSTEWLARGIGKGGLKDVADAQLTLGIAYLRAGNKAEALKTFNSIKATDPNMQQIVRLWKLYAQ